MVQLPKVATVEAVEPGVVLFQYYNYRLYLHHSPLRLLELEELADTAASYMSAFSSESIGLRQLAMNRLRQLYNLEFKLRCDECGRIHYQDEITAPER